MNPTWPRERRREEEKGGGRGRWRMDGGARVAGRREGVDGFKRRKRGGGGDL